MRIEDVRALVTVGVPVRAGTGGAGSRVAAVDVDGGGLRRLVADAAALPGRVDALEGDVSDESQVKGLVREAAEWLEGINVLVNNAAVRVDGLLVAQEELLRTAITEPLREASSARSALIPIL